MSEHRQTPEVIALVVLFLSITLFTVLGFAARPWMPTVASEHGAGTDAVIRYLIVTTGAILAIGTVALVWFLWRYGRGRPTASPATNPRSERWWSLAPVLGMALISEAGVLLIGLPVWERVYGAPPPNALVVEVIAQQFEWFVRFPGPDGEFGRTDPTLIDQTDNLAGLDSSDPAALDDMVFRKVLHLPAGRAVHLRLRSRDVLHSFSVPQFRVKQDVVPGIVIGINFTPTTPGTFEIACAELCGMGHYKMGGRVVVHAPEDFPATLRREAGVQ